MLPESTDMAPESTDMPPVEFREWGRRFVEWAADYLASVDQYPVMAQVAPGEVRAALGTEVPATGEPMEALLGDFKSVIVPGITHWNHPRFFGYYAISGTGPGILGELLTAALNVNAMVWRSSPAATELEETTLDWLRRFVGLPPGFVGTINDTASISTFHALAAARERGLPEARERGLSGAPPGRVYATAETHSSVAKAVIALGLGRDGVSVVPTDGVRRMDPAQLDSAVKSDRAAGRRPLAVVATAGTTSTAAVDPLDAIADVAASQGLWLHVDAAYAGPAACLPALRPRFRGWERADSIVVNPHKWLLTPVDCSVLFVRSPADLRAAFSLTPAFLETPEEGARHLMDHGLALGRRFRALKLWFVMRYFGQDGMRAVIARHLELAQRLAATVDAEPDWERWKPSGFSLVVLRWSPDGATPQERNALNLAVMDRVNASGAAFLSHTEIDGDTWLRCAIGNIRTTAEDVDRAWVGLREEAEGCVGVDGWGSGPGLRVD